MGAQRPTGGRFAPRTCRIGFRTCPIGFADRTGTWIRQEPRRGLVGGYG